MHFVWLSLLLTANIDWSSDLDKIFLFDNENLSGEPGCVEYINYGHLSLMSVSDRRSVLPV